MLRSIRSAGWLAAAIVAAGCPRSPPAGHSSSLPPGWTEIDLSAWGLASAADVGYASVGVIEQPQGDRLAIYDLRRAIPERAAEPPARTTPIEVDSRAFVIAHYDAGNFNRLGGTFVAYARAPARAAAAIDPAERALAVDTARTEDTHAGLSIHLFDDRAPAAERVYVDVRAAAYLQFEIRGARGDESIELRAADRDWELREDSVAIARIADLVPAGKITERWQRASVALDRFPASIHRDQLASLVFAAAEPGRGRFYLRNVALSAAPDTPIPEPPPHARRSRPRLRRAMWLWQTDAVLADPAARRKLIDLCDRRGITDLFLQIPRRISGTEAEAPLRALLASLHSRRIRIDALDGAPEYALAAHHDAALSALERAIAYNRAAPPGSRFDGFRFDVEPYLLPGFAGPRGQAILRDYLALLARARDRAHRAHLRFGADIPFWFDGHNRFGEPTAEIDRRPVSQHVLDIADSVAIMGYRTSVYGPDGMVAACIDELEYAGARHRELFVGIETAPIPAEVQYELTPAARGDGPTLLIRPRGRGRAIAALLPSRRDAERQRKPGTILLGAIERTAITGDKVSFHRAGNRAVDAAIAAATAELENYPGLAGFAIHSYESYR